MATLLKYLFILLLLALIGGAIYFATADLPAPTRMVERPVSTDKLVTQP